MTGSRVSSPVTCRFVGRDEQKVYDVAIRELGDEDKTNADGPLKIVDFLVRNIRKKIDSTEADLAKVVCDPIIGGRRHKTHRLTY